MSQVQLQMHASSAGGTSRGHEYPPKRLSPAETLGVSGGDSFCQNIAMLLSTQQGLVGDNIGTGPPIETRALGAVQLFLGEGKYVEWMELTRFIGLQASVIPSL